MGKCYKCGKETSCNVWTKDIFECEECFEKEIEEVENSKEI